MDKEISKSSKSGKLPRKFEATEHGYVTLPYNENQFKEFIIGLLGKSQTISKEFYGYFEIDKDSIVNIHEMIMQRIRQQNEASLIQFNAKIIFGDRSSVLLNSVEALLSYKETKPITPEALHLSWNFMVKFNDKEVPEKQEIEVSIIDSGHTAANFDEDIKIPHYKRSQGYISCRIKHTARTWGVDIESILTNYFKSLISPRSKLKEYFIKEEDYIGLGILMLFLLSSMIGGFFSFHIKNNQVQERILQLVSGKNELSITDNEKLNILYDLTINSDWNQFYFLLITFIFLMIFVSIPFIKWVLNTFNYTVPAHILLTKQAYKVRDNFVKREKKKKQKFILSVIVSITCSIVANFLFILLTTK